MDVSMVGFMVLFVSLFLADESPRFLAASGRSGDAAQVLKRMYESTQRGSWEALAAKINFL